MIEIGSSFERLTVLEHRPRVTQRQTRHYYLCACECGNTREVRQDHLRSGAIVSCGCKRLESVTKHGLSHHRLFSTWNTMNERCQNRKSSLYFKYGAKGVRVCKRWSRRLKGIEGFKNFLTDMEARHSEGLTLERKNVNLGYNRHNCTWADASTQSLNRNKSTTRNFTSKYLGVSRLRDGRFRSNVTVKGTRHTSPIFDSDLEAANWRDSKIIKLGINAPLNFKEN